MFKGIFEITGLVSALLDQSEIGQTLINCKAIYDCPPQNGNEMTAMRPELKSISQPFDVPLDVPLVDGEH